MFWLICIIVFVWTAAKSTSTAWTAYSSPLRLLLALTVWAGKAEEGKSASGKCIPWADLGEADCLPRVCGWPGNVVWQVGKVQGLEGGSVQDQQVTLGGGVRFGRGRRAGQPSPSPRRRRWLQEPRHPPWFLPDGAGSASLNWVKFKVNIVGHGILVVSELLICRFSV